MSIIHPCAVISSTIPTTVSPTDGIYLPFKGIILTPVSVLSSNPKTLA